MIRIFVIGFAATVAAGRLCACSVPQYTAALDTLSAQNPDQLLAAGHYRRALAQLTSNPPGPDTTTAEIVRHQLLLARTEFGLGHYDQALDLAEKALALNAGSAPAHVQIAAAVGREAERASMFKQLGLAKRAKKELEEALAIDPHNPDAIYGMVLFTDLAPSFIGGDKARAQNLAEQLTEIEPARGYLAQSGMAHNRKDAAAEEALIRKAIATSPDSYEAHTALAVAARAAVPPRTDEADEQACLALAIDPTRSEAWQILAQLAATEGCLREVDGLLATAEKFNPDDLSPAYFAAVSLVTANKNLDIAQSLLNRYLEKPQEGETPPAARARFEIALIYENQGHTSEALDLMKMAVKEDPTLEDAKKEIKRLEHPDRAESK